MALLRCPVTAVMLVQIDRIESRRAGTRTGYQTEHHGTALTSFSVVSFPSSHPVNERADLAEAVQEVLSGELKRLLAGKELKAFNQDFIDAHPHSLEHRIVGKASTPWGGGPLEGKPH